MLTRTQFLTPAKRRIDPCKAADLFMRSLNEDEQSGFESSTLKLDSKGNLVTDLDAVKSSRRRLLTLCLCDEAGNQFLTDADFDALGQLDGKLIDALNLECRAHCGLDKQAEDSGKNSGATAA